jgi:hypothetical protein
MQRRVHVFDMTNILLLMVTPEIRDPTHDVKVKAFLVS